VDAKTGCSPPLRYDGFQGEARHVIDRILDVIRSSGHLMMVSMAFTGASRYYLAEGREFDERRTPSKIGMLSEAFRRRKGVLRSANPYRRLDYLDWAAKFLIDSNRLEPDVEAANRLTVVRRSTETA
jgi:aminoglycoside 3-N-acetyltransferase